MIIKIKYPHSESSTLFVAGKFYKVDNSITSQWVSVRMKVAKEIYKTCIKNTLCG